MQHRRLLLPAPAPAASPPAPPRAGAVPALPVGPATLLPACPWAAWPSGGPGTITLHSRALQQQLSWDTTSTHGADRHTTGFPRCVWQVWQWQNWTSNLGMPIIKKTHQQVRRTAARSSQAPGGMPRGPAPPSRALLSDQRSSPQHTHNNLKYQTNKCPARQPCRPTPASWGWRCCPCRKHHPPQPALHWASPVWGPASRQ